MSDDVLTRAISDVRTQLAKLDEAVKFIETLPKRGYRWMVEVLPISAQVAAQSTMREIDSASVLAQSAKSTRSLNRIFIRESFYVVLALFVAFACMWLLSQLATDQINIAVLPTVTDRPQTQVIATVLDENILALVRKNPQLKLISKSAINSRPQNPFPYFFKEFGAKWVLESRIADSEGFYNLELSLVDARTGIELRNINIEFNSNAELLEKLAQKLDAKLITDESIY